MSGKFLGELSHEAFLLSKVCLKIPPDNILALKHMSVPVIYLTSHTACVSIYTVRDVETHNSVRKEHI